MDNFSRRLHSFLLPTPKMGLLQETSFDAYLLSARKTAKPVQQLPQHEKFVYRQRTNSQRTLQLFVTCPKMFTLLMFELSKTKSKTGFPTGSCMRLQSSSKVVHALTLSTLLQQDDQIKIKTFLGTGYFAFQWVNILNNFGMTFKKFSFCFLTLAF